MEIITVNTFFIVIIINWCLIYNDNGQISHTFVHIYFLAMMTHELKSCLNIWGGSSQLFVLSHVQKAIYV